MNNFSGADHLFNYGSRIVRTMNGDTKPAPANTPAPKDGGSRSGGGAGTKPVDQRDPYPGKR